MAVLKDAEKKPIRLDLVRELNTDDLRRELEQLEEAQFRLRFRSATEDVAGDNPLQFRTLRRNIARLKTVLRERANHE
jgi:large subunit ribosomal protein L29